MREEWYTNWTCSISLWGYYHPLNWHMENPLSVGHFRKTMKTMGFPHFFPKVYPKVYSIPIGSMYAIYGNIYHQYTPNISIYTIHGSYGIKSSFDPFESIKIQHWITIFLQGKRLFSQMPSHAPSWVSLSTSRTMRASISRMRSWSRNQRSRNGFLLQEQMKGWKLLLRDRFRYIHILLLYIYTYTYIIHII